MGVFFCPVICSTVVCIQRCKCVYEPRGRVIWKECFQTISAQHFSTYSVHSPPFPQAFAAEANRKNICNTVYLIAVNCWLVSLEWSEWNIAERDTTYWWRHDGCVICSPPLQPVHISQLQLEPSYFSSRNIWAPWGEKTQIVVGLAHSAFLCRLDSCVLEWNKSGEKMNAVGVKY